MGLDWDLPAYPPASQDDGEPLRVQVGLDEPNAPTPAHAFRQQGLEFRNSGQWNQALATYAKAIEMGPRSAEAHNDLAWLLATCPEAEIRDPGRAVELAKKAVELTPKQGNHWNTLGVAQYRVGDSKAAIEALTQSMGLRKGGDSNDWFFLAMARWQLGDQAEARLVRQGRRLDGEPSPPRLAAAPQRSRGTDEDWSPESRIRSRRTKPTPR